MNYTVTIYETRSYSLLVDAANRHDAKAKGFDQWSANRAAEPDSSRVDFDNCLVEPAILADPLAS